MNKKEILMAIEPLLTTEQGGKRAFRCIREMFAEEDMLSKKIPSSKKKRKIQRKDSKESKANFLLDHEKFMNQYANKKMAL